MPKLQNCQSRTVRHCATIMLAALSPKRTPAVNLWQYVKAFPKLTPKFVKYFRARRTTAHHEGYIAPSCYNLSDQVCLEGRLSQFNCTPELCVQSLKLKVVPNSGLCLHFRNYWGRLLGQLIHGWYVQIANYTICIHSSSSFFVQQSALSILQLYPLISPYKRLGKCVHGKKDPMGY